VPSENGGTLSMIDTRRLATVKTIKLGDGIGRWARRWLATASTSLDRAQQDGVHPRHRDQRTGRID
jgi:hypothetical protein